MLTAIIVVLCHRAQTRRLFSSTVVPWLQEIGYFRQMESASYCIGSGAMNFLDLKKKIRSQEKEETVQRLMLGRKRNQKGEKFG
jgi:hypothetical protein